MARLIKKSDVGLYEGKIVYLETLLDSCFVEIYGLQLDENQTIATVWWRGFDDYDGFDMCSYNVSWRLWDVNIETPDDKEKESAPWGGE